MERGSLLHHALLAIISQHATFKLVSTSDYARALLIPVYCEQSAQVWVAWSHHCCLIGLFTCPSHANLRTVSPIPSDMQGLLHLALAKSWPLPPALVAMYESAMLACFGLLFTAHNHGAAMFVAFHK